MTKRSASAGVALLLAVAACSGEDKSGGGAGIFAADSATILEAWKKAGLAPTADLVATDGAALGGGACKTGVIDGVEIVLCEYADAAAAAKAQPAGLARIGSATGASLAGGKLLLVVTDRKKSDPQGRTINKITTAFRDAVAPGT